MTASERRRVDDGSATGHGAKAGEKGRKGNKKLQYDGNNRMEQGE